MAVLVEYLCGTCAARTEYWVGRPVPGAATCGRCGSASRRQFGGSLVSGSRSPRTEQSGTGATACDHLPGIPGACVLTTTAARMLAARAKGDEQAIARETANQEAAIQGGTLDPNGPVVTMFAGGPPASARPGPGEKLASPLGS
jgi:hypothetical protein